MLALLLLRANEPMSSDRLVDELWADTPPATAANVVQGYVSRLRKALPGGANVLITRPSGYTLVVAAGALDLARFQALAAEGRTLLEVGDASSAAERFRDALGLWRGPPLGDLEHEPFARDVIGNLEELRLDVLETRIQADLACGREGQLVPELRMLVASHPFREKVRAHLMVALYRSERQAEALEVYAEARELLDGELGLEPGAALRRLQRAVLEQDDAVLRGEGEQTATAEGEGVILAHLRERDAEPAVMALATSLAAAEPHHEVVLVNLAPASELEAATAALAEARTNAPQPVIVRVAAFSSTSPAADVVRLATRHVADLVIGDVGADVLEDDVVDILRLAPCDVALVVRDGGALEAGELIVPFGGGSHDWAALELGAWLSRATAATLRLLGTAHDDSGGDASRLLADASLVLQRAVGIVAVPLLSPAGSHGIRAAAKGAGLLILGLPERWRDEALGPTRASLCREPPCPIVVTHRGTRTGLLRPSSMSSRLSWSVTRPILPR